MTGKKDPKLSSSGESMIQDLTRGSVWSQLLTFATPLFLSSLLQMVYSTVDMVVVGQYVGNVGLSAVHIGGEVMSLLAFVAMGMCAAGQVIIAQYVGAGQRDKLNKLIGTMFTFLIGCALVLSVVCFILCDNILQWINTPPEAMDQARPYVLTCIVGLVFINGYHLISAVLRGMGDSRRPLMFIAAASVLNVVLDLIFVGLLGMKAFGAALATVMAQTLSFFWALYYLYRRKEQFGFDFKPSSFRIDRESLRPLVRLGVPMMIQMAAINFSRLFTGAWINTYGTIVISVTGIGTKLQTIAMLFSQALTTAGSSMVAQSIGAEKYGRVPKVIYIAGGITCAFCALMSLVTAFFPDFMFGLFVSEKEVLERAHEYIPVVILLFAGCGLRAPLFALINGSGNSKLNLAVALLDGVIGRIGLTLLLGLACGYGIYGFWYGEALAGFIPIFIGGIYFVSGRWKTRKYLIQDR